MNLIICNANTVVLSCFQQNAERELREETGLQVAQLNIFKKNINNAANDESNMLFHDEVISFSGSIIRYFIAEFANGITSASVKIQPETPDEILQFGFYTIEQAVKMLHPNRAQFLLEAVQLYESAKKQ